MCPCCGVSCTSTVQQACAVATDNAGTHSSLVEQNRGVVEIHLDEPAQRAGLLSPANTDYFQNKKD